MPAFRNLFGVKSKQESNTEPEKDKLKQESNTEPEKDKLKQESNSEPKKDKPKQENNSEPEKDKPKQESNSEPETDKSKQESNGEPEKDFQCNGGVCKQLDRKSSVKPINLAELRNEVRKEKTQPERRSNCNNEKGYLNVQPSASPTTKTRKPTSNGSNKTSNRSPFICRFLALLRLKRLNARCSI